MLNFNDEIQQKFEIMNNRLDKMEDSIKTIISDQVSESTMKVKDSGTEALKEDNLKMQNRFKSWKKNSLKTNYIQIN